MSLDDNAAGDEDYQDKILVNARLDKFQLGWGDDSSIREDRLQLGRKRQNYFYFWKS